MANKILVVGDRLLDRWWIGEASGLSAEAPIPVVKVHEIKELPGGAGNVAENLKALGEEVTTVFGGGFPIKDRLLVGDCQLARWDFGDKCEQARLDLLQAALQNVKAVVVADYLKGSINSKVVGAIRDAQLPTFVDTKGSPWPWFGIATVVFPNDKEYAQYQQEYDQFDLVVRKRSSKGMELRSRGKRLAFESAMARQVRSVCGAGDSAFAAFVSEYLRRGLDPCMSQWALRFASVAAAIAVEKPLTAIVTRAEISERLNRVERMAA